MSILLRRCLPVFFIGVFIPLIALFIGQTARIGTCTAQGRKSPAWVGTWTAQGDGCQVEVTFAPDGIFTRTMVGSTGRESARGRYSVEGQWLTIQTEGGQVMRFTFNITPDGGLQLRGEDGQVQQLERQGGFPAQNLLLKVDPAPAKPVLSNPLLPDWVRPGLRLTYYLITGSLSGSVNGWVPDENGDWQLGDQRYSTERQGYSSHGLVQATVVGLDNQVAALAQPFYLYPGQDKTPVLNTSMDSLVTADSGGDFWMHPRRQAEYLGKYPVGLNAQPGTTTAKTIPWTEGGQTYQATSITILGEASRTFYVYDQASGRLLYLSRLTRHPPEIRDRSQTLPDSVSYATFLRFRGVRQLNLPWLNTPLPETLQRVQAISYRGQFTLQGPGMPPTPLQLSSDFQVKRRGENWLFLHGRTLTQGTISPSEADSVNGPGSLPPLCIAPQVLATLQPGQELDRDPHTGFVVRVAHANPQTVTLQAIGPRQSFSYLFDRQRGLLIRRISHDRDPATPQMLSIRDLQLVRFQ